MTKPPYTATCFGGPLHRKTITCPYATMEAIIPESPTKLMDCDPSSTALSLRRGLYDLERFKTLEGVYPAWCWRGGYIEDETVIHHIELALNVLLMIARVWNGK